MSARRRPPVNRASAFIKEAPFANEISHVSNGADARGFDVPRGCAEAPRGRARLGPSLPRPVVRRRGGNEVIRVHYVRRRAVDANLHPVVCRFNVPTMSLCRSRPTVTGGRHWSVTRPHKDPANDRARTHRRTRSLTKCHAIGD